MPFIYGEAVTREEKFPLILVWVPVLHGMLPWHQRRADSACLLHSSFCAGGHEVAGSSKNKTTKIRTVEIVTESLSPQRNTLPLADCKAEILQSTFIS